MGLGVIVREAEAQLRPRSEGTEAVSFFWVLPQPQSAIQDGEYHICV